MMTMPDRRLVNVTPALPSLWPAHRLDNQDNLILPIGEGEQDTWLQAARDLIAQLVPDTILEDPGVTALIELTLPPPPYTVPSTDFGVAYPGHMNGIRETSQAALITYSGENALGIPPQMALSPHTGLPEYLVGAIGPYDPSDIETVSRRWLEDREQALFGESGTAVPARLRFEGTSGYRQIDRTVRPLTHIRYRQWYVGSQGSSWPVYGGSVILHAVQGADEVDPQGACTVTSSYFPVPDNLDSLGQPQVDSEQAVAFARQAVAAQLENPFRLDPLAKALVPLVKQGTSDGEAPTSDAVDRATAIAAMLQRYGQQRREAIGVWPELLAAVRDTDPRLGDLELPVIANGLWNAHRPYALHSLVEEPPPATPSATYGDVLADPWFNPAISREPLAVSSLPFLACPVADNSLALVQNYRHRRGAAGKTLRDLRDLLQGTSGQDEILDVLSALWTWHNGKLLSEWHAALVTFDDDGEEKNCCILPFAGQYILAYVVELVSPYRNDGWRVFVDAQATKGRILGAPERLLLHDLSYYASAGDVLAQPPQLTLYQSPDPNLPPSEHLTQALSEFMALNWHADHGAGPIPLDQIAAVAEGDTQQIQREAVNIAVHARELFDHFLQVGKIDPERLSSYKRQGVDYKLTVESGMRDSYLAMGFRFSETVHPITITFQVDESTGDSGLAVSGGLQVWDPSQDPEVIYHEVTHGLMWLMNPWPFQMPSESVPFMRALLEGYANYLARSLAGRTDLNTTLFARSAYRRQLWERRLSLAPDQPEAGGAGGGPGGGAAAAAEAEEVGLMALPAPDIYPEELTVVGLAVYDVGMVWARALWAVRAALTDILPGAEGTDLADRLALEGYEYVHGWVVAFEAAAKGMIDAARKILKDHPQRDTIVRTVSETFTGFGILALGVQAVGRGHDGQGNPVWLAGLDAGLLFAVDSGQPLNWTKIEFTGEDGRTGVNALSTAGSKVTIATEWGIFTWDASQPQPDGDPEESGAWPRTERPRCLLEANGQIYVGTNHGVRRLVNNQWEIWNRDICCLEALVLDIDVIVLQPQPVCVAATFADLRYAKLDDEPTWKSFALQGTRFTCVLAVADTAYAGTAGQGVMRLIFGADGSLRVDNQGAIPLGELDNRIVLKLALANDLLYAGTTDGLFQVDPTNPGTGWLPAPGFPQDTMVTALASAGPVLMVGTADRRFYIREGAMPWRSFDLPST